MGNSSDLLDPYPNDDLLDPYVEEKLTAGTSSPGSIYINGTSYSGADITVYAHIYDPASAALYAYKALQNDIKQAEIQQAEARSEVSRLEKKLEQVHNGTPESDRIKTQLSHHRNRDRIFDKTLNAMSEDLMNIGTNVATGSVRALAELQTLSISTNRDKRDVRALGHVGPKGRTRGPRSIAGSMIFTVFNKDPLYDFLHLHATEFDGVKYTPAITDQMPPMDLTIVFANELGHVSRMSIYGVDFGTEGQVMSINDMIVEKTVTFFAWDFDPMRSVAQRRIDESYRLYNEWVGISASQLIFEDDYQDLKMEMDPFFRYTQRQDPYV